VCDSETPQVGALPALVKQVKLMGLLYLEHTLVPSVFTATRLALLELLGSQATISLEHAQLYADLAQLNAGPTAGKQ
jgi:GAF domain-containing protein